MSAFLQLKDVCVRYGAIEAVRHVSLEIAKGEIVTLIGANGAGKSSLLRSIFAQPPVSAGQIFFNGHDVTNLPTHHYAGLGLQLVPEGRRIFAALTVTENLLLGQTSLAQAKPELLADIFALFPRLAERAQQRAGTLSGGEQQMLAIGRALMAQPKLLLLDEPSLGLAPIIIQQIFAALAQIAALGTTIFLVEQNAHLALKYAHRGYVMAHGQIQLAGSSAALLADPLVRAAYLGFSS